MDAPATRGHWAYALALAWQCVGASAQAASVDGRELDKIGSELASLSVSLKTLRAQYDNPDVLAPQKSFAERLTNGEILYLLNDYSRASLVLYDLVDDKRLVNEPYYPRALYFLAESLFQIGHDLSARSYFQELVARRDPQHLKAAVRRLIQIADRTRRWEGLEAQIAVLGTDALPPDVAYIHAKSLLRQGRYAEAIAQADHVPTTDELAPKARYIAGVAQVRSGNYAEAEKIFQALLVTPERLPDAVQLRDLAAMNRGRLLFEERKLTESMDAYQFIERKSPFFEEALYEVTWTHVLAADVTTDPVVKASEYKKAQNALEILLLSEAENPVAPEARLLLGSIFMRLGRHEEASKAFSDVVARYGPLRDTLKALRSQKVDPAQYFEEVVGAAKLGTRGRLPPLAISWAKSHSQIGEALTVSNALVQSESSLKETNELIDKLLAMLDSERRTSFFPSLKEAQSRVLEGANSLVALRQRLLTVEREAVSESLDETRQAQLRAVLQERATLEPEYLRLPQGRADYEGRVTQMRTRMNELQQQAFRLRYDIDNLRAQLAALRVWIAQNQGALAGSARAEYQDRLDQQDREVTEMEALHQGLEELVGREKSLISITSAAESKEDELRARYAANLEREREILKVGTAPGAEGQRLLTTVSELYEQLRQTNEELERFEKRLDATVREKTQQIRAELLKERGLLDSYRQEMDGARAQARGVLGEVAAESLGSVAQTFDNLVLRGDVGVVDVAWALKEIETFEISKRVNEQRHELQILDAEFADILRED